MRIQGRFVVIGMLLAGLTLSGCALDPTYNFDDGTLLKGKQQWETKRHADDWIVPIGDALAVLGLNFLVDSAQYAIDRAIDRTSSPRERASPPGICPGSAVPGQCP